MSAIQFVENYDDLSTDRGYDETFNQFARVLGIELLKAFHLNDSMKPFSQGLPAATGIGFVPFAGSH